MNLGLEVDGSVLTNDKVEHFGNVPLFLAPAMKITSPNLQGGSQLALLVFSDIFSTAEFSDSLLLHTRIQRPCDTASTREGA